MVDPRHTSLHVLSSLCNQNFVKNNTINCIQIIRGITGEDLRATKDFFDEIWKPTILGLQPEMKSKQNMNFDPDEVMEHLVALQKDVDHLKRQISRSNASSDIFTTGD